MRYRAILLGTVFGFLITAVANPVGSQTTRDFTLLTAMIAEGANIYLPSTLIVKSGETVTLKLRNVAQAEHGFSIDELGVKEVLKPGETKEVTLQPKSAGLLRYYCHLHPGHVGGQMAVE
jgi:nitrosocyanin